MSVCAILCAKVFPQTSGPTEALPEWAKGIVSESQVQFAKSHGVAPAFENDVGIRLVIIPPGEFMMGGRLSPEEVGKRWGQPAKWFKDEHPKHRVAITKPFYMSIHETTRGQFHHFVMETSYVTDVDRIKGALGWDGNGYRWISGISWRNPSFDQTDDHPAACISWNDSIAFCKWLEGKGSRHYRLPTEAEWEYACRAGTDGIWWWGDREEDAQGRANVSDAVSWQDGAVPVCFKEVSDGFRHTAPVGSFKPNPWGLSDMIGNIREWCSDWYAADYYSRSPVEDPEGPDRGTDKVKRGGVAWDFPAKARAATRDWNIVDDDDASDGFRVVCELPEATDARR